MQKVYQNEFISSLLEKILKANERLIVEHFIDQHIIRELTETLKNEKKKRKRGARLNLIKEKKNLSFSARARCKRLETFRLQKRKKNFKKNKR